MAKKVSPKANKKAGKPAPKEKKVVKKAAPKAAKPAKKAAKPAKTKAKPSKPVKKAAPAPKKASPPAKPVKAAPKAPVKTPAQPVAKAAPAAKTPVQPVVKNTPAPKAPKAPPAPPLPPIDTSKLPKLPKGIVVKRGKGKLAPGEKRVVKTDVITHHVLEDKPLEAGKQKPEPKGKFQLEYVIRTPVSLLYDFLTTPNGLAEWFADGVDMKNDVYEFEWDGMKQHAKVVSAKLDSYLRLRWLDKPDSYYFEFRLEQDELTGEVALIVTDFGENEDDVVASRRLWETQIQRLIKALGSY